MPETGREHPTSRLAGYAALIVDLPDRRIDLFIRFCSQNDGRLAARKRASHFGLLSDEEVESMERAVQSAYGTDPGGVAPGAQP